MMTITNEYTLIRQIAKEFHLPIRPCKECLGEGEIWVFNGGSTDPEACLRCEGSGYTKIQQAKNNK